MLEFFYKALAKEPAGRQAKSLRGIFFATYLLCETIFFLFTQRRKGAETQRVLIFAAPLLCAKKEERAEKQEAKVPFVVEFLCVSASLRAKKQKLKARNKPRLLVHAFTSLMPWSLKNEPNFRSPQKSKVTCHEFSFLHILKAN